MKRCLFIILTLYWSSNVHAAIAGFDKLRWDMTRQEVQREYPNFESWDFWDINVFTGTRYHRHAFGLQSHLVAGCDFQLRLEFTDNKLYQVALVQSYEDSSDCRDNLARLLLEKYGNSPKVEITTHMDSMMWSAAGTTIALVNWHLSGGTKHVELIYTNDVSVALPWMKPPIL